MHEPSLPPVAPDSNLMIAPIGARFLAAVIDTLILLIPMILSGITIPVIGPLILGFCYKPFFESSRAQATPGKRIMNLRVVGIDGKRIDFKTGAIRWVISTASGFLLGIGHFIAFFTAKKQAAHDLLANTLVVEGSIATELFEAWSDQAKGIFSGKSGTAPTKSSHLGESTLDSLEKLHELNAKGIITEEEYQKAKKKILGD
jgi:uncharacterized RDD family membrane protein YckC